MSSFWWNFHHWLHWKLSKWQLPVQPMMKISSKWRHFRFSGGQRDNIGHFGNCPRSKTRYTTWFSQRGMSLCQHFYINIGSGNGVFCFNVTAQSITWTNVDLSSKVYGGFHLGAIEVIILIRDMYSGVALLKLPRHLPGTNELKPFTTAYYNLARDICPHTWRTGMCGRPHGNFAKNSTCFGLSCNDPICNKFSCNGICKTWFLSYSFHENGRLGKFKVKASWCACPTFLTNFYETAPITANVPLTSSGIT